jgi:hypothetical protein
MQPTDPDDSPALLDSSSLERIVPGELEETGTTGVETLKLHLDRRSWKGPLKYHGISARSQRQDAGWRHWVSGDGAVASDHLKLAPNTKIDASEAGPGVMVGGESNPTYASLSARGPSISLKFVDKDGREKVIKP